MAAPVFVAGKVGTTAFTDTVTVTSVDGGSASGRCILALLWGFGDSTGTIVGAKCNGVAMTSCASVASTVSTGYKYQLFGIVSDSTITTGASNTIEGDFGGGVITHGVVICASFSGVSAISAGVAASLANQTPSWGTISGATGDLAVAVASSDNNVLHTWTGGTGVTKDFDSGTTIFIPTYILEKASASSVTVDATISGSGDGWLGVGVSLAAVSGGGITAPAQSVVLTDQNPTLMAPVAAPAQSVVLTNLAPTIPSLAPVASVVLTPQLPTITGGGLNAPAASVVISPVVPSLMASIFVPVAAIILTPQPPIVSGGGQVIISSGGYASGGGRGGGKLPALEEYPLFQELDKAIAEGRTVADFLAPKPAVLPPPVADAIVAPMPIVAATPPDDDDEEDLVRLLPGVL
jgi:hypothetical protein